MKRLRDKKGQLSRSIDALSAFAIGVFIMIVVVFATLKGASSIQGTMPQVTLEDNATYANMTALMGSVGQFANYGDLIVVVGILAVVILLVSTAFPRGRR
jgi:flagellar biosynthesis protein FlhB